MIYRGPSFLSVVRIGILADKIDKDRKRMFEIATLTILNEQIENKAHCKKKASEFPAHFLQSVCLSVIQGTGLGTTLYSLYPMAGNGLLLR